MQLHHMAILYFTNRISNLLYQIGSGAYIAALTKNKVISDFRSADVALGGQGAPLVPIGDRDLFKDYSNRLNLAVLQISVLKKEA